MKGMMKYNLQQYFKTTRFIMPLAALFIMLGANYTVAPVEITDSFLISGSCLFFIMTWVGVTTSDLENTESEYILILRIRSENKYYLCNVMFTAILSLLFSLISVIVPVVQSLANHGSLFTRPLQPEDVVLGFVLLFFCAFSGISLGGFAHPRIYRERKIMILAVFLTAIFSLVKVVLITNWTFTKWVLWLIPPIAETAFAFGNEQYFILDKIVSMLLLFLLSLTFLNGFKIYLLKNRGF